MKPAIIFDDGTIYVEFTPEIFKGLLKQYLEDYSGDVDKSVDKIVDDLKKETLTK